MKEMKFEILPVALLEAYKQRIGENKSVNFDKLKDSPLSADSFSFYTSVSAVFSSKIEGEHIDLDSFIKHRKLGTKFLPDYTQKIDDLYDAYQFVQSAPLNESSIKKAHTLITSHILQKSQRGKIRTTNMFVMTPDGKIEYIACTPDKVQQEINKLYRDVSLLINTKLDFEETLFFAALIHLVFVKIHPFDDGNGRTGRMLEKWFLAQKLGDKAWFLQSEKYYYDHHQTYYKNIRLMGLEYDLLDYNHAMPFLMMLADVLNAEL